MYDNSDNEKEQTGLYSIGTLSKIANISVDTLRYYDDIGLVKPALTSVQTGYRYYSDEQAMLIMKIIELKQYRFSLNEIKKLLYETPSITVYQTRYMALLKEKKQLETAINKLSSKILQVQEDRNMCKNVLIVDDAAFLRHVLSEGLRNNGYEIAGEARDGQEGFELYNSLKPDVVIMDIVMPKLTGLEALQKIIEQDENAKIVMCSAMGQTGVVTEALLGGAVDFVVKPFSIERIDTALRTALNMERVFNQSTLQRIHDDLCKEDYILTQNEVDELIKIALNNDISVPQIYDFIKTISHQETVPQETMKLNNIKTEITNRELNTRLEKVEQGQEEIKSMLIKLLEKQN